ncbi:conserved Plasmodium protein, unknown function [Plasmodium berghei]|uniref:Fam-a protein n=2 Tax=Plasmodium berghei TaxID=5821 RepID=A0A509AIB0_PLABA|nr:conserved protein, unknown function [Plasmodium berghei ANKA]CXI43208.1 conserved Plasmodium protein, unknown function [Plasmodium berghei]SCM22267.1 conserved Plasmodium protein, unknown function [Plasmodium berghei]SCN25367.1 conserved Plasmodium protein, unknown function [Plasmodium berghei]SCO60334.1 conserved Plasmodium protein, unknown function [Plasmodium berghei]SCO62052.1 conserved Plasmodium protein, unknown function [Plasmodium berghei]|eukprot:XP_034421583.1 conserved protein, unknown function [Plasmodium berghei ANKA]
MKIVVFDLVFIIIFHFQSKVQSIYNKKNTSLPLFITSEINKKTVQRKTQNKNFKTYIWGYPIYDDSPFKLKRPKVYPNFEYGELRKSQDFDYVISTNISQNNYQIPDVGYLYNVDEMGTGRTDDVHTPIEMVFGGDIDMKEVEKIKTVLNVFDQGNGMGICTLMGAKRGHFAFKYNGYLCHFHGIKSYLKFLINRHYPGAKVTMISEHWIDPIDEAVCVRHSNIPFSKIGHQRKLLFNKYDYIYENDKNKRIYKAENKSNVWAFYNDPQMLT